MAYGLSNGHVTDDVMWSPKVLWSSTVSYPSDSLASCFGSVPIRRNPIRRNANPNPNFGESGFGDTGFGESGRHPCFINFTENHNKANS